jgi:hypothetical protein
VGCPPPPPLTDLILAGGAQQSVRTSNHLHWNHASRSEESFPASALALPMVTVIVPDKVFLSTERHDQPKLGGPPTNISGFSLPISVHPSFPLFLSLKCICTSIPYGPLLDNFPPTHIITLRLYPCCFYLIRTVLCCLHVRVCVVRSVQAYGYHLLLSERSCMVGGGGGGGAKNDTSNKRGPTGRRELLVYCIHAAWGVGGVTNEVQ